MILLISGLTMEYFHFRFENLKYDSRWWESNKIHSFQTSSCFAQLQQASQLQHDMDYFYSVYLDCIFKSCNKLLGWGGNKHSLPACCQWITKQFNHWKKKLTQSLNAEVKWNIEKWKVFNLQEIKNFKSWREMTGKTS